MNDRGMIKWQPFNSVVSNKEILTTLLKEKSKQSKPEMSEEEINIIEKQIINAYYMQSITNITYYKNGYLLKIKGKIKKIDKTYNLIYLENIKLLFQQIINITLE